MRRKTRNAYSLGLVLSLFVAGATSLAGSLPAETTDRAIDFARFLEISQEVMSVRPARLLPLDDFLARAADPNVLILDSRSEAAYQSKHLAGAVHLGLSDITQETLDAVLGSTERTVLIYCNNNFSDDEKPLRTKAPAAALNIPTFVTLWAYGFRDVYELGDLLEQSDPRLTFEGLMAEPAG